MIELVVAHPRSIVAAWLVVTATSAVAALGLFGQLTNRGFEVPGSGSDRTSQILNRSVPGREGTQLVVVATVLRPGNLIFDATALRVARHALRGQRGLRSVTEIGGATDNGPGRRSRPLLGITFLSFYLATDPAASERAVPDLRFKLARASGTGTQMSLLGWPALSARYSTIARSDLARAETIAFPVTLVILLVAFLSVVAALLPVALAGATVTVTFALLFLIAHGTGLSVFVTNTASVLALGLSIDFSLFMVTRLREELLGGGSVEAAVRRTLQTTGRAVVLSGLTLAMALLSLFAVGVGLFSSMAIGATLGALVAVLAAVTLVPATVCLLGGRLDLLMLKRAARAARRATSWHVLGRTVVRHPIMAASSSLAILVVLAIPTLSMQLGLHTLTALPAHEAVRQAAQRLQRTYGEGSAGPIDIVTRDSKTTVAGIVQQDPSIGSLLNAEKGKNGWTAMQAIVKSPPDSVSARHTVERLRERLRHNAPRTYVGGPTALSVDLLHRISARTPYVVLITMLLAASMLAFGLRSIVIPIKAVLGTLLSVAATLGVVLRLFPDSAGMRGLEFFVPLFLFVVVFGLSIDYEVFLLSRIAEAVRSGSSNEEAVVLGLVRSGRAITLAGATLATVFLAFATSSLASFRQLGAGVAIAILLDVTLVRCVLVPATVVLLGRWNWWFPGDARRH